jgi:ribosomal protein S18 acetylase RimI-like enzyme
MSVSFSLRPATDADVDFLWDLHRVTLKPYVEQTWGWDEPFQQRYFREHFSPANSQVIQCEGKDAGVITVEENQLGYILSNIELYPQYQGLGIGTTLIKELLDRAAGCGLPVSLRVLKINPARQLYLRLGFSVIGETETHYWMRKEGKPREFLPENWETGRCLLSRVDESALSAVQQVFSENSDVLELLGERESPVKLAEQFVSYALLPPGGVRWREQRFLIRDSEDRETVGILSVYFGYPTPETIYIGNLFLRPICQRRGYGCEVIAELERRAAQMGFAEARAGVGLKNWPALRFWTKCGYSRITKIKGDQEFSPASAANVELLKDIFGQQ